jgi:hypothetical protein
MAESLSHITLVTALAKWTAHRFFGGDHGCIFIDAPNIGPERKPRSINGFVPDLYAETANRRLIIGEAKTRHDVETNHTKQQLEAFLIRCNQTPDSWLILAVPWYLTRCAGNLLQQIQKRISTNVNTFVIEKLPD